MQYRIRAWSSLFLSAIFFTTVLMEYIPTPHDVIEFTFLANFGIGILLLLTGLRVFKVKKAFSDIAYHMGLVMIMLVFIICLIGLSGIYQIHFEGKFFFLHAVNPLLFFSYNVIFVEGIEDWKLLFFIPVPVILYLLFDFIYGTIRGRFIYNLFEIGKLNFIELAGAGILSYNFVLLIGFISLFLHRLLKKLIHHKFQIKVYTKQKNCQ